MQDRLEPGDTELALATLRQALISNRSSPSPPCSYSILTMYVSGDSPCCMLVIWLFLHKSLPKIRRGKKTEEEKVFWGGFPPQEKGDPVPPGTTGYQLSIWYSTLVSLLGVSEEKGYNIPPNCLVTAHKIMIFSIWRLKPKDNLFMPEHK